MSRGGSTSTRSTPAGCSSGATCSGVPAEPWAAESSLAGDKLIVWDGQHVSIHDPRSGTEEQLVSIPPARFERPLGPRRLVTALTTDETRVAWAETDTDTGQSVVRVVDVT